MKILYQAYRGNGDVFDLWEDGTIGVDAYSYEINSYGHFKLNKDETRELYEVLKELFEEK